MDIHLEFLIKNEKKKKNLEGSVMFEVRDESCRWNFRGFIGSYFNFKAWHFVQYFQKSSGVTDIFLGGLHISDPSPEMCSPNGIKVRWMTEDVGWYYGSNSLLFYRTVLPKLCLRIILRIQYPQQRWNTMSSEALKPSYYWTVWIKETLMKLDGKSPLLVQTT